MTHQTQPRPQDLPAPQSPQAPSAPGPSAADETLTPAQSCVVRFPAALSIAPGQCHPHVYLAQAMFQALRQEFPEFFPAPVTGQMDPDTAENLRLLQGCTGLPETGVLDKRTWNRLCMLYRALFDRNIPPSQG